jgi:hypothetical protein
MEAWRQWLTRLEENRLEQRTHLTPTGLLMEGDNAQNGGVETFMRLSLFGEIFLEKVL